MSTTKDFPVVPEDQELGAELAARFVNLTPHTVRLLERVPGGGFTLLADLPPAKESARVSMRLGRQLANPTGLLDADVTPASLGFVTRTASDFGAVTGLPPPHARTDSVPTGSSSGAMMEVPAQRQPLYIVSTLVAQALRGQGRQDVFSPGTGPEDVQRGPDGQVYGLYALEMAPQ